MTKATTEQIPDGFRISMDNASVNITSTDGISVLFDGYGYGALPVIHYGKIINQAATILTRDWHPTETKAEWKLKEWKNQKIGKLINAAVRPEYDKWLATLDPKVIEVERMIFKMVGPANILSWQHMTKFHKTWLDPLIVREMTQYRAFRAFMVSRTDWQFYDYKVEYLLKWRSLLSYTGKSYHALNKTLDTWPGGVPNYMIDQLAYHTLRRHITDRVELILNLAHRFDWDRHADIYQFATHDEIARAFKRVARHMHYDDWSLRSAKHISQFVGLIHDYRGEHNGNIVGLAEKSMEWHDHREEREAIENIARQERYATQQLDYDALLLKFKNELTALPPIELPVDPRIKFLNSVSDMYDESKLMGHCIDQYAPMGVSGSAYYFHVEYDSEMASVEVTKDGYVTQSFGPHNSFNKATKWARGTLSSWASNLVGTQPIIRGKPMIMTFTPLEIEAEF